MKILKYQNILKSICLIGSEIKITHKKRLLSDKDVLLKLSFYSVIMYPKCEVST